MILSGKVEIRFGRYTHQHVEKDEVASKVEQKMAGVFNKIFPKREYKKLDAYSEVNTK